MTTNNELNLLVNEISRNLDLERFDPNSNQSELLAIIAKRVGELFDTQPELLMSYLYRLDIEETKIRIALQRDESPIMKIAELIMKRQLERVRTKLNIKQDPIKGWEW